MADSVLPDDLLLDILARLDSAADLFRCATACKRWSRLVADPSFLRRLWPKNSLAGFFIMERLRDQGAKVFVPMPGSPLGPRRRRRKISTFVPAVPAGFLSRAAPLAASRHGLLLVRLLPNCCPPPRGHCPSLPVRLAVCDLIAGTCRKLPTLPCGDLHPAGDEARSACAILTNADFRRRRRSCFDVVIITPRWTRGGRHEEYALHSFSSATRHWSSRTERFCFGGDGSFCHTGAVGDSTAHWLFRKKIPVTPQCYYLFTYHPEDGGRVVMKGLPPSVRNYPEYRRPCLSLVMDGTLSVLLMRSTTDLDHHGCVISYRDRVEIWSQQQEEEESVAEEDDADGDGAAASLNQWLRTRTVELMLPERMKKGYRARTEQWPYIIGERRGTLLINDGDWRVYAADLETGAMAEVVGWPSVRPKKASDVLPWEMDWPDRKSVV